jgi:hypothetical protein
LERKLNGYPDGIDVPEYRRSLEAAGAEGDEVGELDSDLTSAGALEEKQKVADGWLGRTARRAVAAARAFIVEASARAIAEYSRPPGM